MKKTFNALFILSVMFLTFSCSDDKEDQPDINEAAIQDVLLASSEINEIEQMTQESYQSLGGRMSEICGDYNWNADTKTFTMDFGTGCTSAFDVKRKGKIVVEYADQPGSFGSNKTTTFVGYEVNGNAISGSITTSGLSTNNDGNLVYTLSAKDFSVTYKEDETTSKIDQLTNTYELVFGQNEEFFTLNVTGNASGVTRKDLAYATSINEKLQYEGSCFADFIFYPAAGNMDLTLNQEITYNLDFGDGDCDKAVNVSIEGFSKTITLP